MKSFIVILLINCCAVLSTAQISFEASSNAKQVVLEAYFEVTFTLNNAQGSDFRPPKFVNFDVVGGPSESTSMQYINGVSSRSQSYSYTLQPKKIGKFKIGAAFIDAKGNQLKTKPIIVEVVKGKTNATTKEELTKDIDKSLFVRVIPSTESAKIGQQVTLDYKIYTKIRVGNYNFLSESAYDGFYAQNIRQYDSADRLEVIDGEQYTTKILKRVALFPQQAGALTIEPIDIQFGISTGKTNRRSFFNRMQLRRHDVRTEPTIINVQKLPSDAPLSFSGAVGNYAMKAAISRLTLTTDDAITLQVAIVGTGDIKRVQAPELSLSDKLEIYEPRIVEDKTDERQGMITGKKVFEYLILPKEAGRYTIAPEFSYFDVDSLNYQTLQSDTFNVFVKQGTKQATNRKTLAENGIGNDDIRYIKTNTSLSQGKPSFFGSGIFWMGIALPFLLLGGVVVAKRLEEKRNNVDVSLLKSRRAQKVAQKKLSTAEQFLKAAKSRDFYDEVSHAMLGYICDKLNIPVSELTKENVREKLESLKVNNAHIDSYMKIIKTCEMALFAGMDNTAAMNETYQSTMDVIVKIEEEIG